MFFGAKNKAVSVALLDITSTSVGGAYARVTAGRPVAVLYSTRLDIPLSGENSDTAMLRALEEVLRTLRREGAPVLRRRTGSGSVAHVYANVGARYQETAIRIEVIADDKPFVFSNADLAKARKRDELPQGRFRSEDRVVATLLNGYETKAPLGKQAKRAEIILLSSTISEETAAHLKRALGGFSSSRDVRFSSFASLSYESVRLAFPHEEEYLALLVTHGSTELVRVARGFPMAVASIPCGLDCFALVAKRGGFSSFPDGGGAIDQGGSVQLDKRLGEAQKQWTTELAAALKEFASSTALPRTLFLACDPDAREFLKRTLDVPELHTLWLSDEPLAVIPLEESSFASFIGREPGVEEDLPLELLALFARSRVEEKP